MEICGHPTGLPSTRPTKPRVKLGQVRYLEIPLPPFHEQNRIASILTNVDEKIQREVSYKAELEQTKRGLMQVLLTGKKRVKVDI